LKYRVLTVMVIGLLVATPTRAGLFEFSLGFSFNRSLFDGGDFTWTRRIGITAAYRFTRLSGIEAGFQDVITRLSLSGSSVDRIKERIYSLNWVQSIFSQKASIQPFFKIGVGIINRNIEQPSAIVYDDVFTGVIGVGLRIFVLKNLAFRSEVTSFLEGFKFSTYKDTITGTVGLSLFL